MGGLIVNIWIVAAMLIRIAVAVIAVILIVKGINYLKRKEDRDMRRDYHAAQDTIDEIERELNSRMN